MLWLWMESQYLFEWLATSFSGITCAAIALCITAYQRYLSPRKGFVCAHRVRHRQHSCSEYVKRAIMRRGLVRAIPLIRRRLADCGEAALALRSDDRKRTDRAYRKVDRPGNPGYSNVVDVCNCLDAPFECAYWGTQLAPDAASACGHAGAGACDLGALDAAACCCWPL